MTQELFIRITIGSQIVGALWPRRLSDDSYVWDVTLHGPDDQLSLRMDSEDSARKLGLLIAEHCVSIE